MNPLRSRLLPLLAALATVVTSFAVTVPAMAAHDGRTLDVTISGGSGDEGASTANLAQTLTATISPGAALLETVTVYFELEGGPNDSDAVSPGTPDRTCTISGPASSCSVNYTPTTNNLDQWRGWVHHEGADPATEPDMSELVEESDPGAGGAVPEPDRTDAVSNLVTGGLAGQVLDCDDEVAVGGEDVAVNPNTGSDNDTHETYTCKVTVNGAGVPNIIIDGENLSAGINDTDAGKVAPPDFTCTTNANGVCTITVPNATGTLTTGTAIFCFWIDGSTSDDLVDEVNASNGSDCGEAVDETENTDVTDNVQVTWQARVASSIDIENEDDARVLPVQDEQTVNLRGLDQFGAGIGGVPIDLYIIGGPNADTGSVVTKGCTTAADGTCSVTYSSNGNNGTDKFCAWRDTAPDDLYSATGPIGDGGACATEPEAPGTDGGDPFTDRGQTLWSGGASTPTQLEATPETEVGLTEGTDEHGITVTVKDENGNTMSGVLVNIEIIGAGDPDPSPGDSPQTPDRTCTTGENGQCSLTGAPGALGSSTKFTSSVAGESTIRAWVASKPADTAEGADAGPGPDEPAGTPDTPGSIVEPDTTDVVKARWGRLASELTATLIGPNTGVYGLDPVIRGSLKETTGNQGLGNRSVHVYTRRVGSPHFLLLGTIFTESNGEYEVQINNPPDSADLKLSFAGDSGALGDESGLIRINIRVGVIFNVNPTSLPSGRAATLSGQILPVHPGKKVALQMFKGQQQVWETIKTVTLDSNSRYHFKYTRNGKGYLIFRIIYWTQDSDHLWNVSRALKITWT